MKMGTAGTRPYPAWAGRPLLWLLLGGVAVVPVQGLTTPTRLTAVCEFRDPRLQAAGESTQVRVPGCDLSQPVGAPVLPFRTLRLLLPPGSRVTAVAAEPVQGPEPIPGMWRVEHGRWPRTSDPGVAAVVESMPDAPDAAIYSSPGPYPAARAELASVQRLSGFDVAFLRVYPVRYVPARGELEFAARVQVSLTLQRGEPGAAGSRPAARAWERARERVAALVANPSILEAYEPGVPTPEADGTCDYLLITRSNLVSAFQPLLDLKVAAGLAVRVETVESITNSQAGADVPEKIRNFIRRAHTDWGATYVLLGGDIATVPCRYAYVNMGSLISNPILPCDLYYACLDGSWNGDGDTRWGEPDDGEGGGAVDVFGEVFVGRLPVDSVAEAAVAVGKAVRYATEPHANAGRALFLAEFLDQTPAGPAQGGDMFDPLAPLFADLAVTWLDDRPFTSPQWDKADALAALNGSPHVALLSGHGSDTILIGAGYPFFRSLETPDLVDLTNAWPFLLTSVGCNVGQYDNDRFSPDSVGEQLVKQHERGAFAAVLNSRQGWYDQQDEARYSGEFQHRFFQHLLAGGHTNLGAASQLGKHDLIGQLENVGTMTYRWCYYEITLLGDPHLAWQQPAAPNPVDTDGDGMLDSEEQVAGTDPRNPDSRLSVRILPGPAAGSARIEWPSVADRSYALWAAADLSAGTFVELTNSLAATPPTNVFVDDRPVAGARYYRLSVQRLP